MNRGSPLLRTHRRTQIEGFNEAPIHESGKSPFFHVVSLPA